MIRVFHIEVAKDRALRISLALALEAVFLSAPIGDALPAASAAYLHPAPEATYGSDGTTNIPEVNSFGWKTVEELAVNVSTGQLYLMRPHLYEINGNGTIPPQPRRGIYAYDLSSPGALVPPSTGFPLPLAVPISGSHLAVDESEGNLYYLEASGTPGVANLYSWDSSGNVRPGFPLTVAHFGPMAVDPLGYLWILSREEKTLYKYEPDGTEAGSVEIGSLPKFLEPSALAFNRDTGDLWALGIDDSGQAKLMKLTAASGYATHEPLFPATGFPSYGIAVDAAHGVVYTANSDAIYASTEHGDLIETFAVGGKNWESPRPGGNYGNVNAFTVDEATGAVYISDISRIGTYAGKQNGGVVFGSNTTVWPGVIVPDVVTGATASVGHADASLTGHLAPAGAQPVTGCRFEYVDDHSLRNVRTVELIGATGGEFQLGVGNGGNVSAWIPYNATGSEVDAATPFGASLSVTGPAGGPWTFETSGLLADEASTITLRGNELSPLSADVRIDWAAQSVACTPGAPLASPTDVTANVSGLSTGTTYHYRLEASNANGRNVGAEEAFTTTRSTVNTGTATNVQRLAATLNGTVDPEGLETTYYFEYGPNREYGQVSSAPPGVNVGTTASGNQPVSDAISGLQPGASYHYRIVAVNSKGTSYGVDRSFTTAPAVKHVETQAATDVARTSATLNGVLDPDGEETHYYFQWGKTRRYGQSSAPPPGTNVVNTVPGDKQLSFLAEGLKPDTTYHFRVVADNSFGTTFGNDRTFTTLKAVKDVTTEAASEVQPTSVTLNGSLDPDGIASTTYYFQWGKTTAYGRSVPAPPGADLGTSAPGQVAVSVALQALEPGVTYHFRLAGVNGIGTTVGQDLTFHTPQGPSIEGLASDHVTATGAELKGRINPHGFATSYRFEYGPTTAYGSVVPVPDGNLGPASTGQSVTEALSGLQTATYHFRLVAESQWGTATSEDQTFDFLPPKCPNSTVRQQTGSAYLPDCRAYELVSPERAGGSALTFEGPFSPTATDRFAFSGWFNTIPGAGAPPNGGTPFPQGDLYVASRTTGGWVSHYVGLKGDETIEQQEWLGAGIPLKGNYGIPADSSLHRFLTWSNGARTRSYAPYMWDSEGNSLGRAPTNLFEIPGATLTPEKGGFLGAARPSPDFSHYAFSAIRTAFAPGGLTASPGSAYDNDLAAGTVQIVSKTAAGADVPQDPLAGNSSEYIQIPAVSTDGSHILMSTLAPGGTTRLYMRVNDAVTYEPSLGQDSLNHGVNLIGMSADGSEVYFTTTAQMTADDHDSSTDLYRWSEATDSLTRLSTGTEDTGDTDSCNPTWNTACGVEAVLTKGRGDSTFAPQGGTIYFYSPEQLDGAARGIFGQRNLYAYREGRPRYVTTLESPRPAERMDVSSDGSHIAFLTKSRVTAYDNAGHAELYRFDTVSHQIVCASCRPDGEVPTSDAQLSRNGLFMTDDGRTFFSTDEALVPRDANGIPDVYEYVGGRPQLISSGTGDNAAETEVRPIALVGVSRDGTDVFFSTFQTLVAQDENGPFYKFYDARVNGGFPYEASAAPCAAADECHGAGNPTPEAPQLTTGAYLGQGGNATSQPSRRKHHRVMHHHRRHRRGTRQRGRR